MHNMVSQGFTFIEMLVTIAIVAILASIAIPSFQLFILQTRVATQSSDFVTPLNYARSESIKQGRTVTICKSANATSCTTTGNWDQGWIMFVDSNKDRLVSAVSGNTPADVVLRVHGAMTGGSTLVGGATVSNWVQYSPTGTAIGNGGATATGAAASQFALCPAAPSNGNGRTIEIGFTGGVTAVSKTNCA